MELLTTTKEKYLLEASLEALHEETVTWISALNLWEDEITFYKDILENKMFERAQEKDREKIKESLGTASNKLSTLKKEIVVHERNLNTVLSTETGDYRNAHKKLFVEFTELGQKMTEAKTTLFQLLKSLKTKT